MMSEDDRSFYRRRAAEEQTAIRRASGAAAANAHKILAERYTELLKDPGGMKPLDQRASATGE